MGEGRFKGKAHTVHADMTTTGQNMAHSREGGGKVID